MKKYTLIRDKKLLYYLIIHLFMAVIGYSVTTWQTNRLLKTSEVPINFTAIMVIIIFYYCFTIYFILKDVLAKYEINDEYFKYGTFGLGKMQYFNISHIDFDKDILLLVNNKKKKIRVFDLDKNKEKYIEMLTEIKERAELDFSIEEGIKVLEYYNNYEYREEGKPLRLNGWVFVIFMMMIFSAASTLLLIFTTGLLSLLSHESQQLMSPIVLLIMLVAATVAIIFIAKKHRFAPYIIKGYYIYGVINGILTSLMANTNDNEFIIKILLVFAMQIPMILLVFRYLKLSKRVSYTFIYDKFKKVEKVNIIKDPGFKLFTNKPASLYGIFTWLGIPALIFILVIVMIVTMIFTLV